MNLRPAMRRARINISIAVAAASFSAGCYSPAKLSLLDTNSRSGSPEAASTRLSPSATGADAAANGSALAPERAHLVAATPRTGAAFVCLRPVEDRRGRDASLGVVGMRPFEADDVGAWIAQSLCALSTSNVEISAQPVSAGAAPCFTLQPRLLKAYVSSVGVTKTAVVVLQIDFINEHGSETETFRGQYAGMNWASSELEVRNAIQRALKECLTQVRPHIENRVRLTSG